MNFLVSGVGGATLISIAKRIKQIFPDSKIIGTDLQKNALGFHIKDLIDFKYIVPSSKQDNYWDVTHKIIKKHKIDIAFIQSEYEVIEWSNFYLKEKKFPCPVLIPEKKYAENLMDKSKMSDLFEGTDFIPKTISLINGKTSLDLVEKKIGYPCWIRANKGSGGYGSLKINNKNELESWLFINKSISNFTVSEFLPGKHLANQMMYINGECIKNAGLECVEYVMADIAPSKVTGNTSFGKLLNNDDLLCFCEKAMDYLSDKLNVKPHGVFSFDLKLDKNGNYRITEINIRHMAYTGVMANAGFDLVNDTIMYLLGNDHLIKKERRFKFERENIFLRGVDTEPLIINDDFCYNDIITE